MTDGFIELLPSADSTLYAQQPLYNWGGDDTIMAGRLGISYSPSPPGFSGSGTWRGLLRFKMPFGDAFPKNITSIKFRFYPFIWVPDDIVAPHTKIPVGIHLVETPQDDVWVEGDGSGFNEAGMTNGAVCWLELGKQNPWDSAGGDFDDQPIGLRVFDNVDEPDGAWYDIEIPIDNLTLSAGKTISLMVVVGDESTPVSPGLGVMFWGIDSAFKNPKLVIDFDLSEDLTAPVLTVDTDSNSYDVQWDRSPIRDSYPAEFKWYEIEYSDVGPTGPWTPLTTWTSEGIWYGIVSQSDVDNFDEDLDTYPNGKTRWHRVRTVTYNWGNSDWSNIVGATTKPVIRPMKVTADTPLSKNADLPFIDNNQAIIPYGTRLHIDWYDPADTTPFSRIKKIMVYHQFYAGGVWGGSPYIIETIDISGSEEIWNDIIANGIPVQGYGVYSLYKTYLISIYDMELDGTDGLYREFTVNKTSRQDYRWFPAPCPVVVPDGPFLNPPPDMGGPFSSGTLMTVDLSIAGQQSGGTIFNEDMLLTPTSDGKWINETGNFTMVYGMGSAPGLETCLKIGSNLGVSWVENISKVMKGESIVDNEYNRWWSKYTGGFRTKMVFSYPTDMTNPEVYIGFDGYDYSNGPLSGYYLRFVGTTNVEIWRGNNFSASSPTLLASVAVGGIHPNLFNGLYFCIEFITSPVFDPTDTNEGDWLFLAMKGAATLADALNLEYDGSPTTFLYAIQSDNRAIDPTDQIHFTGKNHIRISADPSSPFEIYYYNVSGRVGAVDITQGQGYGTKNLITDEVVGLVSSSRPKLTVFCAPDQVSQVVTLEARIKNEYGAQSRTGEVDGYQGDTFNNSPPVALLITPLVGYKDVAMIFNASASYDPEGGDLIYEWDWDDGSPIELSSSSLITHTFTATGTYVVKLRVKDEALIWSSQVTKSIKIVDQSDLFVPLTFICPEPFIDIGLVREDGDTETPMPGRASSYYQNNRTGGRKFDIKGQTVECANLSQAELVANAQAEIDLLDAYYSEGTLVEIDLPLYGIVQGFISGFRPTVTESNPRFWTWSMVFKEVIVS